MEQATVGTTHRLLQGLNISIRGSLKQGATRESVSTKQAQEEMQSGSELQPINPRFLQLQANYYFNCRCNLTSFGFFFLSLTEKSRVE